MNPSKHKCEGCGTIGASEYRRNAWWCADCYNAIYRRWYKDEN